jgi:hypothetical protein
MKSDLQYLYISLPYDIMFPVGIFFLNVRSLIHILFSFACTVIIRPAHTNKTKEDMGLLPPPPFQLSGGPTPHCKEDPNDVFPKIKLRGLVPISTDI